MITRMGRAVAVALAAPIALTAQSAADSASVTAFYREWFSSAARDGPVAYAGFYAEDGTLLPPNAAPARGRTAIAEWMRRSQLTATYTTRPEGVSVDEMRFLSPTLVAYRSTLRGQRIPKSGGEAMPFETKYFDLLRRSEEGKWQVVYRMWSDNR
jgi:uncharacterized protein (TIGR02246 family)